MQLFISCLVILLLSGFTVAKAFTVPPMPMSQYADTEVSTNIAFNTIRNDVKYFALNFLLGSDSLNGIQVALGRDKNKDGVLALSEIDTVYGYRNGRYIIEYVSKGLRYEEPAIANEQRNFSISIDTKAKGTLIDFSAKVGVRQIFSDLIQSSPDWLYHKEWNLMRITRRGVAVPDEWVKFDIDYSAVVITVK